MNTFLKVLVGILGVIAIVLLIMFVIQGIVFMYAMASVFLFFTDTINNNYILSFEMR